MRRPSRQVTAWTAVALVVVLTALFELRQVLRARRVTVMTGAIVAESKDPHLQRPIGNATLTVRSGANSWSGVSENSGLFRLRLDPSITISDPLQIRLEHPNYIPVVISMVAGNLLYIFRMTPKLTPEEPSTGRVRTISNLRVRYATRSTSTSTIGSAVRTFDVTNTANVPCAGHPPCSPDRKWKATVRSFTLDTGEPDKQFRNVRVSCIAGPCPFTQIEQDRFSRGGRQIAVAVRNWSDPVTYVIEAEVATTMDNELIRHTYPVTFGRAMNFTLPAVASSVSVEADVDGSEIVFPLGPELRLSWAACRFEETQSGAKQFRCELKPGYRFGG